MKVSNKYTIISFIDTKILPKVTKNVPIITIGTVISCPGVNDTVKYCLPAGRKNYLIKQNVCSIMKYKNIRSERKEESQMKDVEEIKEKIIELLGQLGERDKKFLNHLYMIISNHLKR